MADEESVEQEEQLDPFALFSPEVQNAVEGLTYLGQLSETLEFCGHTFGIRTLLPQDKFAISVVMQPYRNTIMEVDVYQAAHVGASLTAIDGDEDFCPPIGPGLESAIRGRLTWLAKNLYPPTVEYLWVNLQLLEVKASQAVAELDRLSKRSQPTTLPPWLGSLTEQGNFPDETVTGIQPSAPSN